MVLSTETFNQSVRTEYSEAVNARYTFQPLWVSAYTYMHSPTFIRTDLHSHAFTYTHVHLRALKCIHL